MVNHDFLLGYGAGKAAGGGGGGIDYEEGSFSPMENTSEYSVSFTKTHEDAPALVFLSDASSTAVVPSSVVSLLIVNVKKLFGGGVPYNNSNGGKSGFCVFVNKAASGSVPAVSWAGGQDDTQIAAWATKTGFKASGNLSAYYFYPSQTYKWIAIWK